MRHRPDHKGATFDVFYTSLFAMMVFVYSGLFVSGELGGSPSGIEFSMWGINFPSMHPLALYMAMASFFVFVLLCLMWKKDVRVGLIATAGMFFYGGMTVVGELFRFSDDVVTVFNDVPLLILIGIFICFVAVVSLISTFVVLKKRSHVVHHLYEEDVEK
jgi:prolipoprotein diacylglyceryltransferase